MKDFGAKCLAVRSKNKINRQKKKKTAQENFEDSGHLAFGALSFDRIRFAPTSTIS
jgi:hypothetical protein